MVKQKKKKNHSLVFVLFVHVIMDRKKSKTSRNCSPRIAFNRHSFLSTVAFNRQSFSSIILPSIILSSTIRRLSRMRFSFSLPIFFLCLVPLQHIQATFLSAIDFSNAHFVPISDRSIRPHLNDQRFKKPRHKRGSGVLFDSDKWPKGRVPYVLSAAYTPQQRAVIAKAISAYNTRTCIRFVPRTIADKDYVTIAKLDGCFADFAKVGGVQQVSLADECIDYATIIHELMHVIGFIHEHQREDRSNYVSIIWQNVIPGAHTDFEKLSGKGLSYYGANYDYFSILHYEATEGSRNGGHTIEAKHNAYTGLMGKSTDFTRSDLARINRAYKCYGY